MSAFYRFSYPHTWVGTILSVSSRKDPQSSTSRHGLFSGSVPTHSILRIFLVVSYISYKATHEKSIDALNLVIVEQYLIALFSALCVNVYIVGINQIFDVEIDRVNKPYLPLASGEWTLEFATYLCAGLLAVGLGALAHTRVGGQAESDGTAERREGERMETEEEAEESSSRRRCCARLTHGCASGVGFVLGTIALQYTLCVSAALGTAYSTDLPLLRWKKCATLRRPAERTVTRHARCVYLITVVSTHRVVCHRVVSGLSS